METQAVQPSYTPVSHATTVGELRRHYGETFASGYEDTDLMTSVLGRAGIPTLGEYLRLYQTT